MRVTWDDLDIPSWLREVADGVWDAHMDLWASGGTSEDASARLDELSARYEHLFQDAEAVSHDALEEAVADARQAGAAERGHVAGARPCCGAGTALPRRVPGRTGASATWADVSCSRRPVAA